MIAYGMDQFLSDERGAFSSICSRRGEVMIEGVRGGINTVITCSVTEL